MTRVKNSKEVFKNELTIVGIDPGTTTAVAILDLEGELIALKSDKGFDRAEISQFLISKGKPLIVATDVSKAPSLVEKISSTFGAQLFVPDEDLTKEKKEELAEGSNYEDSHQLDAAASAFLAFKNNRDRFERVKSKLRRRKKEEKFEDVLQLVMNNSMSVKSALKEVEKAEKSGEEVVREKKGRNWEKVARKRKKKLKEREEKVENLREYIEDLEDENSELQESLERAEEKKEEERRELIKQKEVRKRTKLVKRKQKEIESLERKIEESREKVEHLQDILNKIEEGWKKIEFIKDEEGLKNTESKIVYLEKGVKPEKVSEKVKAVISKQEIPQLEEKGVAVIDPEGLETIFNREYCIVKSKKLEEKMKKSSSNFMDWIQKYRSERKHASS